MYSINKLCSKLFYPWPGPPGPCPRGPPGGAVPPRRHPQPGEEQLAGPPETTPLRELCTLDTAGTALEPTPADTGNYYYFKLLFLLVLDDSNKINSI